MDLALIPTDELVKALSSRFEGFICCGVQEGGGDQKADRYYQFYTGSIATAKGLVFVIDDHLNCVWADVEDGDEKE